MALVAVHLAEHGRARKLMVAAMIAMTVPLALDAVLYVWSLHPTQLELHREHLGRFLQSKGWRPGSPHHLAYEHRIEQNDAVGTFGLSNLLGSVAACFMVLVVPLVLGRIKAMGWRSSLIPLCTVLCGLTLIALTRSKGAVGALAIGLLLLAMAWHLRVTGNTWVRRLLGPMAIAVLFIVIGIVVIRGMLGPYMSASNIPTLFPIFVRDMAKFTAKVDLPTPPFPLAIAIIFLAFILNLFCGLSVLASFLSAVRDMLTDTTFSKFFIFS